MARKYDRYGRNRQFRRNPTRNPKFFPYQLPFLPDFRLKIDRNTTEGSLSNAKWRDLVREARGRTARSAVARRDKRAREELDLYTNSQHQIRNAMGEIMLGESALYRESKRRGNEIRFFMFDEFRL